MKRNIIYPIILMFVFTNCVDEIKLGVDDFKQKLIVDGNINTDPGPYSVQLSYSLPYTETVVNPAIGGAQVTLTEVGGISLPMQETRQGIYKTDSTAIVGQTGKSYFITIRLSNGFTYKSKPEKIAAPVPIDTYSVKYVRNFKNPTPFSLTVRLKDPIEKDNYYRWKWTHYEKLVYCLVRRSKDDLGKRYVTRSLCCEDCWEISKCAGCIEIASDGLTNGKYIEKTVAQIPFESREPYFIILEQHSLTRENYNFWNLVSSQVNNSGGIFDKAPAQVQGNLYNVADSTEQVLGYFAAIGITQKPIYVKRNEPLIIIPFPGEIEVFEKTCFQCGGSYRTKIQPKGW
jgi:Domain of unknown function (DUF4249)